ncbi:hypothetical protein IKQ19_09315 [Candidatus Saccharibacteria bacterium]|nr:hypothetical protein [Candidatus Saccharibacteria bacterium]
MKKVFVILVLCVVGLTFAQSRSLAEPAPREHRGFYSNTSFGFALNWFDNSMESLDKSENKINRDVDFYEYYGYTFLLGEFKFGYALGNLVALHTVFNIALYFGTVDYYERYYTLVCIDRDVCFETPNTERHDGEIPTSDDGYNIRTYLGFGATFYPFRDKSSPLYGAFIGGSVGSILFAVAGSGNTGNGGVGFELELGKEWWLNDHLSIGFGLGFAHFGLVWNTVASHRSDNVLSLSFRITRG